MYYTYYYFWLELNNFTYKMIYFTFTSIFKYCRGTRTNRFLIIVCLDFDCFEDLHINNLHIAHNYRQHLQATLFASPASGSATQNSTPPSQV